jgi:hypothetical protein
MARTYQQLNLDERRTLFRLIPNRDRRACHVMGAIGDIPAELPSPRARVPPSIAAQSSSTTISWPAATAQQSGVRPEGGVVSKEKSL